MASLASRRSASRGWQGSRGRRALLRPWCMLRSALACLDWLVLVIAMFNGDPARFAASASWHLPSPAPPPLPVLAPSECPTKTLFLCRERDRPRFSVAEFRLRRDAYDAAKVQYSILHRAESLGSRMDVDPGRDVVDLEAAGEQSDGTDLCSSDGEIAPASGAAAGESSNASQAAPSVYDFSEPRVHRQPSIPRAVAMPLLHVAAVAAGSGDFAASCEPACALWQMLTSVPAFGVQGACRPVGKTGVTMRCRPTADDTCSGARMCRLELSPITPRELSLLSLVRSQSAFSCDSTNRSREQACVCWLWAALHQPPFAERNILKK